MAKSNNTKLADIGKQALYLTGDNKLQFTARGKKMDVLTFVRNINITVGQFFGLLSKGAARKVRKLLFAAGERGLAALPVDRSATGFKLTIAEAA